ncbi:capsule biosynthesis protein [Shimia aestuarii]|uniref:capsule biosynthesis protein n=1 Tax=Shimia aestuarii TaxID=254406 RepID=UPI001FB40829|nr:capsule biosynthesis protein [Shimia aestuarii]
MTTKPKAKKFRIRRSAPTSGTGTPEAEQGNDLPAHRFTGEMPETTPSRQTPPQTTATPPAPQPPLKPSAPQGAPQSPAQGATSPDQEIDAIKREGLTGRQLRMARRMAQKNGLAATSDYDAVRLLRANGLDPFQRTNMLELVVPDGGTGGDDGGRVQLPQTLPMGGNTLPSTETYSQSPAEKRAREIGEIQRDIAKRRRRRLALLFTRLAVFVFLPTIIAGWYFFSIATPMYATKSEFLILQADNAGGSGIGSFLSGTQFATNQDSIATQSFLVSKDALVRLDKDENFKEHFADPSIDPIQRLPENPTNEQAYSLYKKYVKVGYDPTEGVIRMEVSAADPEVAARFSRALISYAEQRVDDLSQRKREDQMRDARRGLEKAKKERREAQAQLVSLQEGSLVDPEGLIASLRSQISNVQIQLQEKELQLAALEDNPRPNRARVEGVKGDVRRLQDLQAQLEAKMTDATAGGSSLAQKTAQIQMAQADLATADLLMQTALQTLKQTELEANRQVRYLTTSVEPVASQDPSYPRAFEDTMLAFLIFSGIYLMISLTASILREQVSS